VLSRTHSAILENISCLEPDSTKIKTILKLNIEQRLKNYFQWSSMYPYKLTSKCVIFRNQYVIKNNMFKSNTGGNSIVLNFRRKLGGQTYEPVWTKC
jgi:hypothetical protein